jgi:hypothetical protein
MVEVAGEELVTILVAEKLDVVLGKRSFGKSFEELRGRYCSTTRSLSGPSRRPWASCASREEGDVRGKWALSMREDPMASASTSPSLASENFGLESHQI